MDFRFTPEEEAFRREVRAFLEQELGSDWLAREHFEPGSDEAYDFYRAFEKKVAAKGWLVMAWPKEYGGQARSHMDQLVYHEEFAYFGAPVVGGMGVGWVGPAIMTFGTEEQKKEHIPKIAKGEVQWCTLYSEPGAGSDLAALQSRAVEQGDYFVINGQKIWTTGGQRSQWGWLAARTDPDVPKHKGITTFVVKMDTPGITIRPLLNMAGDAEFSEVFFDDVKLPKEWLVGVRNRGWYQVAVALDFERSGSSGPAAARRVVEEVVKWAKTAKRNGRTVGSEPTVRAKLAEIALEIEVGRSLCYRVASMQSRGLVPNYEASVARMFYAELNQRFMKAVMEMMGLDGQLGRNEPWSQMRGRFVYNYLRSIGNTIETGTSEIQRNIIAQRGLGLPRG